MKQGQLHLRMIIVSNFGGHDFDCRHVNDNNEHSQPMSMTIYSVSQKKSPCGFLTFSPNGWEFLMNFLHTYYTILSTLDD